MSSEVASRGVYDLPLPCVDGTSRALSSLLGEQGTVIVFVASGCPTARAYEDRLISLQDSLVTAGMQLIAVNSNNASLSPPDTMQEMSRRAAGRNFNFTYLKDPDGAVARSFGAVCTPHAFLLDRHRRIVYDGRIDDSRLGDRITSTDLRNAVDDVMAERAVKVQHTEPFGCSIVW